MIKLSSFIENSSSTASCSFCFWNKMKIRVNNTIKEKMQAIEYPLINSGASGTQELPQFSR